MKIFWSWQSDTPGDVGRYFVRDALKIAVEALKERPDIEEPTAQSARDALHLDQDRAGVPGSPDLALTILGKIERSTVFVADVTPVGVTADGKKKLTNPNVAIELGYALHALGDQALLMVLNEHYGSQEDLPFDLRHKAGPITYRLAPSATREQIKEVRNALAGKLKAALRPYLTTSDESTRVSTNFVEQAPKGSAAVYFQAHEILAELGDRGDRDETEYRFDTADGIALRVVPTQPRSEPIRLSVLDDLLGRSSTMQPFHAGTTQAFRRLNSYGAISFEPARPSILKAATQLFENGEIWGFNSYLFRRTQDDKVILPSGAIEKAYRDTLPRYVAFARDALQIPLPYTVVFGLSGAQGAYIAMPDNALWGPIRIPARVHRLVLNDVTQASLDAALLSWFEILYGLTGYPRPKHLYDFPPR